MPKLKAQHDFFWLILKNYSNSQEPWSNGTSLQGCMSQLPTFCLQSWWRLGVDFGVSPARLGTLKEKPGEELVTTT